MFKVGSFWQVFAAGSGSRCGGGGLGGGEVIGAVGREVGAGGKGKTVQVLWCQKAGKGRLDGTQVGADGRKWVQIGAGRCRWGQIGADRGRWAQVGASGRGGREGREGGGGAGCRHGEGKVRLSRYCLSECWQGAVGWDAGGRKWAQVGAARQRGVFSVQGERLWGERAGRRPGTALERRGSVSQFTIRMRFAIRMQAAIRMRWQVRAAIDTAVEGLSPKQLQGGRGGADDAAGSGRRGGPFRTGMLCRLFRQGCDVETAEQNVSASLLSTIRDSDIKKAAFSGRQRAGNKKAATACKPGKR